MATSGRAQFGAGEIFLRRLAENGVDYLFANAGTDFAPVIEVLARGQALDEAQPEALVIPHEAAAMSHPRGSTYLAHPREALRAETAPAANVPRNAPALVAPHPTALEEAVRLLDEAERPLIIAHRGNGVWNAVRTSSLGIFPDGHAARAKRMPLTSLELAPDYCLVARASRAWTARVDQANALDETLAAAARFVAEERRQALVEVIVRP